MKRRDPIAHALEDDCFHPRRIKDKRKKRDKYPLSKVLEDSERLKEDW